MTNISVDAKIAIKILDELNKDIFEKVRLCIQKYSLMVETMAKDNAPTDVGRLKTSIVQELYLHATEIVGTVGTNVDYGYWQHEGTKPHWVPFYNGPTWTPASGIRNYGLMQWARRHGFDVDGKKDSKGNYIKKPMMGLYVKGIANPYILEAFEYYEPKFQEEITKIVEEAVKRINGK